MDNQSTAHILKALQTANDLIGLVNNSYALRNDKVCDILLGVMRHCACKIYRQVEREHQALKSRRPRGSPTTQIEKNTVRAPGKN